MQKALAIEDYGLIGDCISAALVGRNGSLDWLCWPRFDRAAVFARLLGDEDNGYWSIAPVARTTKVARRYCDDTMVLETVFTTKEGSFALIDFMPMGASAPSVVRIVEGRSGHPRVCLKLKLRFDYGSAVPWVTRLPRENGIVAIAGPNLVVLRSSVPLCGENLSTVAEFRIAKGKRKAFVLSYGPSHLKPPRAFNADAALKKTEAFWRRWSRRCSYKGDRREAVMRSLLTLKALSYARTGGIIAAPTTSLPEQPGGERNWDYRYCWIRDATLTLAALMGAGYFDAAGAWLSWLQRSLAGSPEALQIMYGVAGERRLDEWQADWLSGHHGARPVRIGNAASRQLQLDIWGEMMDALHLAREGGIVISPEGWELQKIALGHLAAIWREPDDGIWEVRGGRRHFTHSKIMAWVAFDRSIRDAQKYRLKAPLRRWRALRNEIHRAVCEQGFSRARNSFTQSFGSEELDASLLLIPHVGFLPIDDPRVSGTIAAIENELMRDGLVLRYRSESGADGLPVGEGAFLPCSFWLADAWRAQGRDAEASALVDRLLGLRNDLGLLSEEYDSRTGRQVGNFPQAFTHLAMVQSVMGLSAQMPLRDQIPATRRSRRPSA